MGILRKEGKQRSRCLFPARTPSHLWTAVRANVLFCVSWEWGGGQGEGMNFLVHGLYGLAWFGFCCYCKLQQHVLSPVGCKTRHD